MTHFRDMTPEQRAVAQAEIDAFQASKPAASEADVPAVFVPGAIIFVGGQFRATTPDIVTPWPWVKSHIEALLSLAPMRHRLEHWHERIERGQSLLIAYFGPDASRGVDAAGFLNLEVFDDGRRMAAASLFPSVEIDLTDLSAICETVALLSGAHGASIWTPQPVPLCSGWTHEDSVSGFLQTIAVEPLQ